MTPSPLALLPVIVLQVSILAGVLWTFLRRDSAVNRARLPREVALIATVTFLAFLGGAMVAVAVLLRVPAGGVLGLLAFASGLTAGYVTLRFLLGRIFHLEPQQARRLAGKTGLVTVALWVVSGVLFELLLRVVAAVP